MSLDKAFIFSANNLQDYLDCPRRFKLKHILRQSWPAVLSQPVQELEFKIQLGNRFHQIVHQFLSGVSSEIIRTSITDPDLLSWFLNFLKFIKPYTSVPYFSEFSFSMPFEGYRLRAVLDFIVRVSDSEILILDWKTTHHKPKKELYIQAIQSMLYPFVTYENRNSIFSQKISPLMREVSMAYWFPEFPESTIPFDHSETDHLTSQKMISCLISEISSKISGDFDKTPNSKHCMYCQYRSLCERGIQAGETKDMTGNIKDPFGIENVDFDQIEGISF